MEEPKTPEQVRILLEKYHDIPAMIAEEEAVIRHCQEQMQVIALSGVCINGLPGGKGQVSDPTATWRRDRRRSMSRRSGPAKPGLLICGWNGCGYMTMCGACPALMNGSCG